ncbi:MAG: response regulator [Bacteriovorax sp.]|nr:response regulator [Bacteriovorax sp.]
MIQAQLEIEEENKNRILFVDDEAFILFSLRRFFKQHDIEVDVETDCIKAVELIRENKYKVIISDFRMPTMNGADFLEVVKEVSPDSVRLVLSAHVTQESLLEIINKSEAYRFVSKPWRDKELLAIIQDSIVKHDRDLKLTNIQIEERPLAPEPTVQTITILPENLNLQVERDNFLDSILPIETYDKTDTKKLSELMRAEQHQHLNYIINLTSSKIGNHCKRVSQLVAYIGKSMKLPNDTQKNLYYAGMYHDIGKLFELVAQADHSELGANLLASFSELKEAANIVRYHHKRLDEEGASSIPLESKILAIVDFFDKEVNKEFDRELDEKAKTLTEILGSMVAEKGKRFDAEVLDLFNEIILKDFKLEMFFNETKIHMTDMEDGMVLSRPLFNIEGKMLLNSEYKISKEVISRLFKHNQIIQIKCPMYVYTKAPEKTFNFEELVGKKIKI